MSRMLDKKDKATGKYPFVYTDSRNTDVSKTFSKARREMLESLKPPTHQPVPLKKRA